MKSRETQLKRKIEKLNAVMIGASADKLSRIRQALVNSWAELAEIRRTAKA